MHVIGPGHDRTERDRRHPARPGLLPLVAAQAVVGEDVEHIIQKLGVSDRTQAAVLAATHGLLEQKAA